MIKASSSLQDLRSGLYGKRKAERPWRRAEASVGSGGVADGESGTDQIGPINLGAKCAGARSEGYGKDLSPVNHSNCWYNQEMEYEWDEDKCEANLAKHDLDLIRFVDLTGRPLKCSRMCALIMVSVAFGLWA